MIVVKNRIKMEIIQF